MMVATKKGGQESELIKLNSGFVKLVKWAKLFGLGVGLASKGVCW